MRFVLFYHSLISDWNHGNAHFLRGVVRELLAAGHDVAVYEPDGGWSLQNLLREHGPHAAEAFRRAFPQLRSTVYDLETLDLDRALEGADVVIAHEWNPPELIARLNRKRASGAKFRLLFHDTHHRAVTKSREMAAYDLSAFDGVLAFGEAVRQLYVRNGWSGQAWTWHEAADTALFKPIRATRPVDDLVWIGNWGDRERSAELLEFLVEPSRALGLRTSIYGVRYPQTAKRLLASAGIAYHGWLPNYRVPAVFSRFQVTVHVPRRPYVKRLPGIPTIRMFEALACAIPLICAPWDDAESLFGSMDFLRARNGDEMRTQLQRVLADRDLRRELARNGLRTIETGHTCAHRVRELLSICESIGAVPEARRPSVVAA
ncbi:CgeB family protein [Dongia deserti]|uniref:CgeB family protein n=1 Tax=Dongia deserti TaxID=2268030 RepID=UPI000E653453|nr:glycosyltransferase [Dongia deserti]